MPVPRSRRSTNPLQFTYLVSALLSVGVANTNVVCSDIELLTLQPPNGQTCGAYMGPFAQGIGGYLTNPDASADCGFCQVGSTNAFLQQVNSSYDTRWRDFGLMWVYVVFNVAAAVGIYWLARVPKKARAVEKAGKKV